MTQVERRILYAILFTAIAVSIVIIIVYSIRLIRRTDGPWDLYNVVWYSEDPKIEIIKDENHYLDGYLYSDEEKIEIHLVWGPGLSCEIVHKDGYPFEDGSVSDKILLEGEFSYNGEYVTLQVETDKVYDYKYKEIILYKRAVDVEN